MVKPSLAMEFTCPLCGGHGLSLPDGYGDSSMATCDACGTEIATWGQLKAIAAERSGDRGAPQAFKGLSSVKGSPRSR